MMKLIRLLLLCLPIVLIGLFFRDNTVSFEDKFNPFSRIKKIENNDLVNKIIPKTRGKWIVGSGPINDYDSLSLETVFLSASDGDTIFIRPGEYQISTLPNHLNLTLRGLTSNVEEVVILINNNKKRSPSMRPVTLTIENLTIKDTKQAIDSRKSLIPTVVGNIKLDTVHISSQYHQIIFSIKERGKLTIIRTKLSGNDQSTAIYLNQSASLNINHSQIDHGHVAIDSNPRSFSGDIKIKTAKFLDMGSTAIILYGGNLIGHDIEIKNNMAGIILRNNVQSELKDLTISQNALNGIDIGRNSNLIIDNFKIENNRRYGIVASGENSRLTAINGLISNNEIGLKFNQTTSKIKNTSITKNDIALYSRNSSQVVLTRVNFNDNLEKIKNISGDSKIDLNEM